jgi:hypothetical protein
LSSVTGPCSSIFAIAQRCTTEQPAAAVDRAGRERRLRYCARPPFAPDRLRELDPERLVYDQCAHVVVLSEL